MVSADTAAQVCPAQHPKEQQTQKSLREFGLQPQQPSDDVPAHAGRGSQSLGWGGEAALYRHRPGLDPSPGAPPHLELVALASSVSLASQSLSSIHVSHDKGIELGCWRARAVPYSLLTGLLT